ncbi:Uncharacterized protein BP5553_02232 [Venustampulla echinocandica]|uniref:Homeobox domain-containing protein n=1 Tax=Venustampulla echinocandica TaxID=2656787 RepID=A0A370U3D7_9HELO|nr:Uncharacterized protein BP5553_02232 [Venustampulla echinocandica]RDL42253.1 Uncharacterized protein BP5553_02232 [Venustampulla echinocandica]
MIPHMDYFDPSFQRYSQALPAYPDAQHINNYAMAHQSASMMGMAPSATKNETKPRLGKDEVDILEREFQKNPKPTTQTKRGFAEDMGVELARINNWFQNRRAKRKQEKKQAAYEAAQAGEAALAYSDAASSPEFFGGNGFLNDGQRLPMQQQSASFPVITGPPPPAASYNPQYRDPPTATIQSLHRTMAAAQAASHQDFQDGFFEQGDLAAFDDCLVHDSSNEDRAQFPASESSMAQFDGGQSYSYPPTFSNNIYTSPPSNNDVGASPADRNAETHAAFNAYPTSSGSDTNGSHMMATFPSQLLAANHHGLALSNDAGNDQSPEEANGANHAIDFTYDVAESDESSDCLPDPSTQFKAPPPPTDIASRRKNAVKPAALTAETLRSRPSVGPRTVSHPDGFRRPGESPISSPMRRIVSAGVNRNIMSGRICKSGGIESAQRSPINLGGFADADTFMEHNLHSIRNPPSLTALSSLNSSLAPPTPMSPRDREMTLVKEGTRSTASPLDGSMNFVFNTAVPGCFTSMEGDQNLASPPETPQAQMVVQTGNAWPNTAEYHEKRWGYEAPDEALFTPAQEIFPRELHMPQPTYLANLSQPVTPAFGQFNNPDLIFSQESPQYLDESPQYAFSTQSNSEYSFPDSQGQYSMAMSTSPSMNKQKTFQFSNSTPADFSEKQ